MTRARGDKISGYVDGTPYMAVAGELYRRGEDMQIMATHTRLDPSTIRRLCFGEAPRIWKGTADAARRLVELLPEDERDRWVLS